MLKLDKIYNIDCNRGLDLLDDDSIDLCITSPPYDNLRKYNGFIEFWNFDVFKTFCKKLYKKLKVGGVCVWIVNDQTKKGSETGTSFLHALYFLYFGFNLNDTMIWRKKNPMPQIKQLRYSQEFEYMFVFSKGIVKTFNPIMISTKGSGNVYNSTVKVLGGEGKRIHKSFKINDKKVHGNVFDIAIAQNKTIHPAVFPEEVVELHIKSWSNEGDVVLDPFIGSGTTSRVAKRMKRHYIGFEVSKEYVELARKRTE